MSSARTRKSPRSSRATASQERLVRMSPCSRSSVGRPSPPQSAKCRFTPPARTNRLVGTFISQPSLSARFRISAMRRLTAAFLTAIRGARPAAQTRRTGAAETGRARGIGLSPSARAARRPADETAASSPRSALSPSRRARAARPPDSPAARGFRRITRRSKRNVRQPSLLIGLRPGSAGVPPAQPRSP